MSGFQTREDTGALFRNKRASKATHPSHTGNIVLSIEMVKKLMEDVKKGEPMKIDLSCWVKETKDNKKYFTIAVKHPSDRGGQ